VIPDVSNNRSAVTFKTSADTRPVTLRHMSEDRCESQTDFIVLVTRANRNCS